MRSTISDRTACSSVSGEPTNSNASVPKRSGSWWRTIAAARCEETLLTFLECGGSHVDAAKQLNIHRNTLAYRLKQIADATQRDPAEPSARLTLHLALLGSMLPPAPV
ncbi:MAG: helix-turn-helix domain-containing protein [Thermomicrobiales bacterium]